MDNILRMNVSKAFEKLPEERSSEWLLKWPQLHNLAQIIRSILENQSILFVRGAIIAGIVPCDDGLVQLDDMRMVEIFKYGILLIKNFGHYCLAIGVTFWCELDSKELVSSSGQFNFTKCTLA